VNNNDQTVNSNTLLNRHALMYALVISFVAGLTAFDGALATGAVPIPHSWAWITPILAIMAVSLTTTLPKVVDGLPPATSQASIESVAKYQQPTVATLAPAPANVPPTPPPPPVQAQAAPTEHVVTLKLANAAGQVIPVETTPTAKVIDVATIPPAGTPPQSPPPGPAADAAPPAQP